MPLQTDTKFPSRLAWVLKLRGDATREALAGRLENLVTGRRLEFGSGPELIEAIVRDVDASAGEGPAD